MEMSPEAEKHVEDTARADAGMLTKGMELSVTAVLKPLTAGK